MTFKNFGFVDPYLPKCSQCKLDKNCKTPKMKHSGGGKSRTLIIGERPGNNEDQEGRQFVGEAGFALEKLLKQYGLMLHHDFWLINTTNCFVEGNPKPTHKEMLYCWPLVQKAIDTLKPDNIWLMGGAPIEAFYMKRFSKDLSITRFRGFRIPDREHNAWIFPMYHPSYVLVRNSHDTHLRSTYERDIKHAIDHINKGKPQFNDDWKEEAQIETESKDIIDLLREAKEKSSFFFFDYETSGLKPYNKGHKIYTISYAALDKKYNNISLASFPLQYPKHFKKQETVDIRNAFVSILKDPKIRKGAHNIPYEDTWSEYILKAKVKGWFWCTMTMAHLIDERHKITSLDFQSYINLGLPDYSSWLDSYKKAKTANSFNSIHKADLAKLLIYGGTDSWAMRELFLLQLDVYTREEYLQRIWKHLFRDGTLCLTETSKDGIKGDREYFEEKRKEVSEKAEELKKKLNSSDIGKAFRKIAGTEPNLRSPDDLKIIVYDILGCESDKITAAGNKSVDQEVLESIEDGTGWVKELLEYKKSDKIVSTFIKNMQVELNDDNYIRPSYFLLNTSGRSCVAKGTKILAVRDFIKYPDGVPIEKIKKGDYVYCFDDNLKPTIKKVLWAGKTGKRRLTRLYWIDSSKKKRGHLDVTPEHKIRTVTGEYVEASKILLDRRTEEEKRKKYAKSRVLSISRCHDKIRATHRPFGREGIQEHRIIYKHFIGELANDEVIHHKNLIHLDHTPSNLEKMILKEHSRLHTTLLVNEPGARERISKQSSERWKDPDFRKKMSESRKGINSLNLTPLFCYKALAKSKGRPKVASDMLGMDFQTFKNYFLSHNIDPKNIRMRYDRDGIYISKGRLKGLRYLGIEELSKTLGKGTRTLHQLAKFYNIKLYRFYKNQFGYGLRKERDNGNHIITHTKKLKRFEDVYDIEVEDCHNFIANEICVHNSASSPNVQQIPKRQEYAKKIIRRGLIVEPDEYPGEVDYGSMEWNIATCHTQDPEMIKFAKDPHSDIHRDTCMGLFFIEEFGTDPIHKKLRQIAKNSYVFPELYGSYWGSCSKSLWEDIASLSFKDGTTVRQYLANKGIFCLSNKKNRKEDPKPGSYEYHVKEFERKFWKRFSTAKEWQEDQVKFYLKHGYIENFFGFRRRGYLSKNQVINTNIQGSSFHCLLWSMVEAKKIERKEGWKSKIRSQIHDEIKYSAHKDEIKHVMKTLQYIMVDKIREVYPWIIVPLKAEHGIGPLGSSWLDVKELSDEEFKEFVK